MGFTPYTTPTKGASYIEPIPLDLLKQGTQYREQLAQSNLQDISALHNSIFNIPTYGKDKEVLMQKDQELKNQLSQLNLSNLGSMETSSQIKNLISQAANDQDVAAIAQRYGSYANELKRKEEAEAKGKQYISPLLRQAEKYYGSGVYKTDTKFNGSGFVAPDSKDLDEIAKNTPEWQNIVTKGGYDITQKGKAEGTLANNYYTHFNTDPKWNSLLNDQFQQNLEGIDIQNIHSQGLEGVKQLFPHLPPDAQQKALADIEEGYQLQQNNPYIGDAWKDKLKDDYFQNQAYMAAQAKTYVNTIDKKQNAYTKDAIDFQQAKELAQFKEEQKNKFKEIANSTKISDPVRKTRLTKAAVELGIDIADATQPDGYISNEALDNLGVLKAPKETKAEQESKIREDVSSVRDLYKNKPEVIEQALKSKIGRLGFNFDANDIESVEWNKDTQRYEVTVDDAGYGSSTTSFTQEELDALKAPQEGEEKTVDGETAIFKDGKWQMK